MIKKFIFIAIIILAAFSLQQVSAQVINEKMKKRVSVGADIFTDIWFNLSDGMDSRTINQGTNVFMQYNFLFNETGSIAFGVGPGISNHNLFSNSLIKDIKGDSIIFEPITEDYNKAKVNVVYIYIPMDLKFRLKHDVKLELGFDFGWKIDSKQKLVIKNKDSNDTRVNLKQKNIDHLDKFMYGPSLRIGWKYITAYAHYQINGIFENGYGADNMNYLSVGISFTPF
jgi:hypothetical protein